MTFEKASELQVIHINLDMKLLHELKACELWNTYLKQAEGLAIPAV